MTATYRMATGGRINRSKPIVMRFNGQPLPAFEGDTAASALLANGIHMVARSFKYHRPRGMLSHGSDEPNALLDVDRGRNRRDPNNRATVVDAADGLALQSQNHWPSLTFDIGEVNNVLGSVFVAGFYYKTFMWPQAFWKTIYEPIIRRAAGLGAAPTVPDPDRYTQRHAHCEVLVVGAGPAGLAAALAASQQKSARVMLCDEQSEPGGSLLHDVTSLIDGSSAAQWTKQAVEELRSRPNVTLLTRTTAFGYFNHNHIALTERITDHLREPSPEHPRERLWQVRAGKVILATGAHERPLVFADNDRPGIMLAESLRCFVNRYAVRPGNQVAIATSGASAYKVALDLKAAGIDVTIVDVRAETDCGPELTDAIHVGIEVLPGHTVVGTKGRSRVSGLICCQA
jgi:sarcosine oxidase, subunit alpha